MVQSSFTDRLQRIGHTQHQPVAQRMVAGVSEASQSKPSKDKTAGKAAKVPKSSKSGGSLTLRLVAGFGLMFISFQALSRMNAAQAWLEGSAGLAQYASMIMVGVAAFFVFVMLFFAFKMQRAAFRVMSEPWRMPFAIGMVLGFAMGIGPMEFTDSMLAQLQ